LRKKVLDFAEAIMGGVANTVDPTDNTVDDVTFILVDFPRLSIYSRVEFLVANHLKIDKNVLLELLISGWSLWGRLRDCEIRDPRIVDLVNELKILHKQKLDNVTHSSITRIGRQLMEGLSSNELDREDKTTAVIGLSFIRPWKRLQVALGIKDSDCYS
jgi:hypothetical protein